MIELDGLDDEGLQAVLDNLAMQRRYVAFSGARVVNKKGALGSLRSPLPFGPMFRGRQIATVGAPYTMPGESNGGACCPHFANGQIEEGAPDVLYRGQPVVMMGHRGTHWPSCDGARAPAAVAEGWKIAFMATRSFAL